MWRRWRIFIFGLFFAVSLFVSPFAVQAALYAPGATLDPACAPTDINCGVAVPTISSGAIGQVPYYASNGIGLTATSSLIILSNGYVGVGTTSPFTNLSIQGNGFFSGTLTTLNTSTTNASSTNLYASSITAGNILASLQSQNKYVLRSVLTKIAEMKTAPPARLRILEWGDSVAGFHANGIVANLRDALGDAGRMLSCQGTVATGQAQSCITQNATSGDVHSIDGVNYPYDFTSFPTGTGYDIGDGGCVTWGQGGTGYVTANKLSIFYIKESGAGTLTMSTERKGGSMTAGPSADASNTSKIGAVLSTTMGDTGPYQIQACASGGRVKVWGPGFENTTANGVIVEEVARGGAALSDMNYTSTAITDPWYTALDPDLVTFEMKNDLATEPVTTDRRQDLNTFVTNWENANPFVDFLLIGSSPVETGDDTQISYNKILASVAQENDAVYWDAYNPAVDYLTEKSLGWITDSSSPHQTTLGQAAETNLLWSDLGLGSLINSTSTNPVNNSNITTGALNIYNPSSSEGATSTILFSNNYGGTPASIASGFGLGGMTFTAPRDLSGGYGFNFNSNDGTNRLYIDSSDGYVGIASSTPGSLLSVGDVANLSAATSTFYGSGGLNITDGCYAINGTCVSSKWTLNGSSIYYSGGNVGINTNTPLSLFTVSSSTANSSFTGIIPSQFTIQQTGSGMAGIDFVNNAGANPYPKARIAMSTDGNGAYLNFGVTHSWNTGINSTPLTLSSQSVGQSNGSVGIASTTPSSAYALSVGGSILDSGNLTLTGNQTAVTFDSQYDNVGISGSITYAPSGSHALILNAGRNNFNDMQFQTNVGGVSYDRLTILNAGNIGIGTTAPATLLEVGGSSANVTFDGYLNCSGFTSNANGTLSCAASDERLKQRITPLGASTTVAALEALSPVSFYWKQGTERGSAEQFGLIAQDVQKIFPNLVSTTSPTSLTPDGTLTLNYSGLIAPLVRGFQEVYKEVQSLSQTVAGFADSFTTKKLCLSDNSGTTCYSRSELSAALANADSSSSSSLGGSSSNLPSDSPTCTLTASPVTVTPGDHTVLFWSAPTADTFSINNGIGAVSPAIEGTTPSKAITADITYTGTVTDPHGAQGTCSVSIKASSSPITITDVSDNASSTPSNDDASTTPADNSASTTPSSNKASSTPDTTAPTVTPNGDSSMNLTVGDIFTDPGATAADDTDGDLTASISETGSVGMSTLGSYSPATNAAGNTGSATRSVTVSAPADTISTNSPQVASSTPDSASSTPGS